MTVRLVEKSCNSSIRFIADAIFSPPWLDGSIGDIGE
jgi:hypothetical protein